MHLTDVPVFHPLLLQELQQAFPDHLNLPSSWSDWFSRYARRVAREGGSGPQSTSWTVERRTLMRGASPKYVPRGLEPKVTGLGWGGLGPAQGSVLTVTEKLGPGGCAVPVCEEAAKLSTQAHDVICILETDGGMRQLDAL